MVTDWNGYLRFKGLCRNKQRKSNKWRYGTDYSRGQRVELLCGSLRDATVFHLSFDDHAHELNAAQNDACAMKVLEARRRRGVTLDGAVVMLGDVVKISFLAVLMVARLFGVERL